MRALLTSLTHAARAAVDGGKPCHCRPFSCRPRTRRLIRDEISTPKQADLWKAAATLRCAESDNAPWTMPHGPYAGESIFNPMPLHPAPPGLPTTANGCVNICAIIAPHVTTQQNTRASVLANRISCWAKNSISNDRRTYEAQSANGSVRAYPILPGQLPRWHGPANLRQPVNAVPVGQVSPRESARLPADLWMNIIMPYLVSCDSK